MFSKTYSPAGLLIFCISIFLLLPVCVDYSLFDPLVTPRIVLIALTSVILIPFVYIRRNVFFPGAFSNANSFILFLLFITWTAFSIFNSINPGDAWFEWMGTFLFLPILLFGIIYLKKSEAQIALLKFSQACILIFSAIYIYQWIINLPHLEERQRVFGVQIFIASTMGNKNFYAETLCMLLPFSIASIKLLSSPWRIISFINCVLIVITLIIIKSLAVIIAAFVSLCIVGILLFRAQKKIMDSKPVKWFTLSKVVTLLICIGLLYFVSSKSGITREVTRKANFIFNYFENPESIEKTSLENGNSIFERLMLWRNSALLVKEHPIVGSGTGNWKTLQSKYGISGTDYINSGFIHYEHPHNDFLLILSENGIIGLILFLGFFILLINHALRCMRNNLSVQSQWMLCAGLFAVISFLLISFASYPRMRFCSWILLSVHAGIISGFDFTGEKHAVRERICSALRKAIPALLIVLMIFSSWSLYASIARFNAETHLKQMFSAKQQKNYPRLVREVEKANSWFLTIDAFNTPLSWYEGVAYFNSNDIAGAKKFFEEAIDHSPYHVQLLNDLATCYEQTGDRNKAIQLYREANKITPYYVQTVLNLSASYYNNGEIDSSFSVIDKIYEKKLVDPEKANYETYIKAILYAKAYNIIISFTDSSFVKPGLEKIKDEKFLMDSYNSSKHNNEPFAKIIREKALTDFK